MEEIDQGEETENEEDYEEIEGRGENGEEIDHGEETENGED